MSNLVKVKALGDHPEIKQRIQAVLKEEAGTFITSVVNITNSSGALQKCDPNTIWGAAMKACALKLPVEPGLGYAYIIPYGTSAQFQLGYKGLLQLAIRSGQYRNIHATPVFADEIEHYHPIKNELKLKDNPEEFKMRYDDKSKPVGYYARFELLSGYIGELYMPIKAVEAHAKRFSKAYNKSDSPWKSDFDAMAEKTVLKKLIGRYGILSVELRQALKDDDIDYAENNIHDSEPENKEAPTKEKIVDAEFEEKPAESTEEAEETGNEEETPWD
jgi:recombination protein RecT